ncbi:NlpC/P60 family protein [Streptomyces radicis]|uniref:Glycoside hydrolase n=1 Tax=Streptomyces radicis TaxID=1750517 RepID=A0A3A9W5S0_9ACTN|nr:C40 family peptidase [Streptomyces radicis]RKN08052.1 glycoside hydrolase [Streptomyces radicis]RKN20407.1 glycoside hydrolase [Streptomyces radicis]
MASHRKPRVGILDSTTARRGAVGVGAFALASATLLGSSTASADDEDTPEIEEQRDRAQSARERALAVREEVDALYQEAGLATQEYNAAEEASEEQRDRADAAMDEAAAATDRVNDARRTLGAYAAAQYRTGAGGMPDTAALLLAEDFRSFFTTQHALERLGDAQQHALDDFADREAEAEEQRAAATAELTELESAENELAEEKERVQEKLAEARTLLDQLTTEEQAELDELERLEREEAERLAEQARQEREEREARERAEREAEEAAREEAAREEAAREEADTPPPPSDGGSDASQADAAIAFAEAQLGKPYVWGATGPNSYDCSGLTQAAWREAGVEIPRVTFDQVTFGTPVTRDALQPGDLVFFYDDISHVGLYIGNGTMIHAPKPGDVVKYDAIDIMPWHSAIRPA